VELRRQDGQTSFELEEGGTLNVYPDLISKSDRRNMTAELLNVPTNFRQYTIHCNDEPRAHFLLHEKATKNFKGTQPGYKYGVVTMKAKPLSLYPKIKSFANKMLEKCGVESWNVGVDIVLYRGKRDKIKAHSDNDQGEIKILSALIQSPATPRRVLIQNVDKTEQFELFLGAGDAYDMDGVMQEHYTHSVPEAANDDTTNRIALVLRQGDFKTYDKDSGRALENLDPREIIPKAPFGHVEGVDEGDSFSRMKLRQIGAHWYV